MAVSRATPVSTSVIVTAAPAMTAPVSSCTVPSTRDVRGCAAAGTTAANTMPAASAIAVVPITGTVRHPKTLSNIRLPQE